MRGRHVSIRTSPLTRGDEIIDEWHDLSGTLIVMYSNGLVTDPVTEAVEEPGYPAWWLNYTGSTVRVSKNATFAEIRELI